MRTILIVEDDLELVNELTEILLNKGYRVLTSSNGTAAIKGSKCAWT